MAAVNGESNKERQYHILQQVNGHEVLEQNLLDLVLLGIVFNLCIQSIESLHLVELLLLKVWVVILFLF
jgi:hypothetical protein